MQQPASGSERTALLLTGGGARAAYQVGVLKAIAEQLDYGQPSPFGIICGMSAGAINAAILASHADDFRSAVDRLEQVWSHFHVEQVFDSSALSAVKSGLHWMSALLLGGLGRHSPHALLDNTPLRQLLQHNLHSGNLQRWIDRGLLRALCITASSYNSGCSVSFFQGRDELIPWKRSRRLGLPRPITLDHLMASIAIPVIFPAIRIGYEYFADGSLRLTAPLSAPLHLGAEHLLVVGVREDTPDTLVHQFERRVHYPSLGQIAGYILDTLFIDSLATDIERLQRINNTLEQIPAERRCKMSLRHIDFMPIFPSNDAGRMAIDHIGDLPLAMRYLLHGLRRNPRRGTDQPLISYLMFEGSYCSRLIDLGYRDARIRASRLQQFLSLQKHNAPPM